MTVRKRYSALLIIVCAAVLSGGCADKGRRDVLFSYGTILRNEFIYSVGKVIPVTIEQSTEFDGSFSENGLYLFYSSDRERGNFDIYLRSLSDITTVRITDHPSRDTSPAVSPNGKWLAFVSRREDPEGDIFVVRIDSEELLTRAEKSPTGVPALDSNAKNITLYQDPVSRNIGIVRDANPAWSPDGRSIAFSSNRDGKDNIWMIERDGKNMRQITRKGGMYPRFSENGKKIIFISYREEGRNGDVYTVDIATRNEKRITDTHHIELYPGFLGNEDEIVYTLIDSDSNGDGIIDLKDASLLVYKNLKTGIEYPLTLRSQSSFAPRWSGALKKVNARYHNVIIYSDQTGDNININIIPEEGIIPLKNTAEHQHGLAQMYLSEYDDNERYLLGLERVYHFFGDKKDTLSKIYTAKALVEAGRAHAEEGNRKEAERIQKVLSSLTRDKNDFRFALSEYLKNVSLGKPGDSILRGAIDVMRKDDASKDYLPFIIEDLGDEEARLGKSQAAVNVYSSLMADFPKYKRLDTVAFKAAKLLYPSVSPILPEPFVRTINSSNVYLKIDAAKSIIGIFAKEPNYTKKINAAGAILREYDKKSDKEVTALMRYVVGETFYREGNHKSAAEYLEKTLAGVGKTNFLFYKANMLLGTISEKKGDLAGMEKYYFENVKNYLLRWKQNDFREILTRLVHYYDDQGMRLQKKGKHSEAAGFYEKYITVVTTAHLLRRFGDIYSDFGSRAHVHYIDSFSRTGNPEVKFRELEKKYNEKLAIARLNYDKAYIYGLAYIYTKLGVAADTRSPSSGAGGNRRLEDLLRYFKLGVDQIAWALFMDDTYVDPYILQGWISQYVDQRRRELGDSDENIFSRFFPRLLWEANIPLYEKALNANDESRYPEAEGIIYLNLANTYFLLNNYPAALRQYENVTRFKRGFDSPVQEALFHFHMGFCYWQDDQLDKARDEMRKTHNIYNGLAQLHGIPRYRDQIITVYRYFALFDRMEHRWSEALGWYNRIMEFSETHRIEIDRARYLQEIANCYKEMGRTVDSLEYLDRADKILASQTEEEKTYKLRFKVFGLGPVSFWNLGVDTAVIGDSRLYEGLDTYAKKLLSISMREDIHFNKGDYTGAVRYLKEKLDLWGKRDNRINRIGRVRTLNNIGYCFYRMGRHEESLKYFRDAWDYAASPEVNDLEGISNTIMNYTNLFVLLLERESRFIENPEADLENAISRISRYKADYKNQKFEQDYESLKQDAKARKREIEPAEVEALREAAAQAAGVVYHQMDIAVGTLRHSYAEHLLRKSSETGKKDVEERALKIFRYNSRVHGLYSGALESFTSALDFSQKNRQVQTWAKLLLNIAACQMRLGLVEDAYETLSGAEDLADDYAHENLRWMVYYKTADFLKDYGAQVERAGHLGMAAGYYSKALEIIEECPRCYAESPHLAESLYDSYARFLIQRGNWREALNIAETKYSVKRIMLISRSSPVFHRADDRKLYDEYSAAVEDIARERSRYSSLLETGESKDSPAATAMRKEVESKTASLRNLSRRLKKEDGLIQSYLVVPEAGLKAPRGAAVFSFIDVGEKIFAWSLDGSPSFEEITGKVGTDHGVSIKDYLVRKCIDPDRKYFVILNYTAANYIYRNDLKDYPPFSFTPSFERVRYYMEPSSGKIDSVFFRGAGLAKRARADSALKGVTFDEGAGKGTDFAKYSMIIDDGEYDSPLGISLLFGRKLPACLFMRRISPLDLDQFCLLAESSLYSGIRGLVIFDRLNTKEMVRLIRAARKMPLDLLNRGADFPGFIPVGTKGCLESPK